MKNQSRFYDLLENAKPYQLIFSCDSFDEGPQWDANGKATSVKGGHETEVEVWLIALGEDLYRLARNTFLEPPTTLHWGDEFIAMKTANGALVFNGVMKPPKFTHQKNGSFFPTTGSDLANKIHELGGGWETIANYFSIVTLPIENLQLFQSWRTQQMNTLAKGCAEQ
jgi:hypothetical protein